MYSARELLREHGKGTIMGKYEPIIRIADLGNLTRAAEALGYSQSSLSYIVNNIEQELGVKLFLRDRHGLTLTDAGKALLNTMVQIEALENQLKYAAQTLQTATFHLGTLLEISTAWLASLLRAFQEKNPDTHVQVSQGYAYSDLIMGLQRGEIDCAFYLQELLSNDLSSLEFTPLYEDTYYAVVPLESPLAQYDTLSTELLLQQPPFSFLPPSEYFAQSPLSDLFTQFSAPHLTHTFYTNDITVLKLVESGLGFSVLPGLLLSGCDLSHVKAIPLSPSRHRTVGLLYRAQENTRSIVHAFLQVAKDLTAHWPVGLEEKTF